MSTSKRKNILVHEKPYQCPHVRRHIIFLTEQTFLKSSAVKLHQFYSFKRFCCFSKHTCMYSRTHSIYLLIKSFTRILLTNLLASFFPSLYLGRCLNVAQVYNSNIKNIVKFYVHFFFMLLVLSFSISFPSSKYLFKNKNCKEFF
jgi:hypothetical protein